MGFKEELDRVSTKTLEKFYITDKKILENKFNIFNINNLIEEDEENNNSEI